MDETTTDDVPDVVTRIKQDRTKALRAPKNVDGQSPDVKHLDDEPRTAARYIGEEFGVPKFEVVTTQVKSFPVGKDSTSEAPQDHICGWVNAHEDSVEVIDVADEDGFSEETLIADGGSEISVEEARERISNSYMDYGVCTTPTDQLIVKFGGETIVCDEERAVDIANEILEKVGGA